MAKDFLLETAEDEYRSLEAQRLKHEAELMAARAEDNPYAAKDSLRQMARIAADQQALSNLYDRHAASLNPQQPEPMTDAEFMAMSPEKMMKHPEAVERILGKSKYYSRDMWNDPVVQERVREGQAKWASDNREYSRRGQR